MFNVGNVDETLIILSMMDQIIVDDLVQEAELEIFEKKKKWHDLWRSRVTAIYGLEEELPGWGRLKERVIKWLKEGRSMSERKAILDRCLTFLPYGPLPDKACSNILPGYPATEPGLAGIPGIVAPEPGFSATTPGEIQASPGARELSVDKICRLLGLEDQYQELFPSQWV